MAFAEWLAHFKTKSQKEEEEAKEKRALRSMWQQEKLAAALDDEPDEIPEDVFEMAVSSITKEDDIVSEPLAQIYERQEKWGAAADMYRKLALEISGKKHLFCVPRRCGQEAIDMITLIVILIILACTVLAFFILVQAPKGGGLTGNFGTLSTQVMGVKQSTDIMEKGTWSAMGVIAALCIITVMFIDKPARVEQPGKGKAQSGAPAASQQQAPAGAPAAPKK